MKATFDDFFQAVWGYAPFAWQTRLAERVVRDGWPSMLDLPTGSGKTAALDIALYHLAADRGVRAARRVVLVVDRRVVVDQVGERAARLLGALLNPAHPATSEVAAALRDLVGPDAPLLQTTVLRGATVRDDAWAHYPHVPVLAASTVDQVGSRLLFRGYGVSDGMRPVHAGLVGCDTLLLLDEVHLSQPFADVLAQLHELRGAEGAVPRRFQTVQLSATPGRRAGASFQLDANDRDPKQQPRLARRLRASKPMRMEEVKVKASADEIDKREVLAARAADHARLMLAEGRRAVAVVLNRVDSARRAWAALEDDAFERVLLTGRMRPLDQAEAVARISGRVMAGRTDALGARPLVIVATQCIEAGADFDFDGLVTECASLDAVRQRAGRLDRLGDRGSRGVILVRSDQLRGEPDAVYGAALKATWAWLKEVATDDVVDLGIESLQPHLDWLSDGIERLLAPRLAAPILLPAYLDKWVQTSPRPDADPDPSMFLHGVPSDALATLPDVQVVWRADITDQDLTAARYDADARDRLIAKLEVCRPGALEALSLTPWALKRWLGSGRATADDLADVDAQRAADDDAPDESAKTLVLAWRGRRSKVTRADELDPREGSIVVLPATTGGLGPHGTFDPEYRSAEGGPTVAVSDLGDAVQLLQRGRPVLRLDPRVYPSNLGSRFVGLLPDLREEDVDVRAALRAAMDTLRADLVPESPQWLKATVASIRSRPRPADWVNLGDGPRWAVLGTRLDAAQLRALLGMEATPQEVSDSTTEGEDGSFTAIVSQRVV